MISPHQFGLQSVLQHVGFSISERTHGTAKVRKVTPNGFGPQRNAKVSGLNCIPGVKKQIGFPPQFLKFCEFCSKKLTMKVICMKNSDQMLTFPTLI